MTHYRVKKTLLLQLLERSEEETEVDFMSLGLAKGDTRTSNDADTRRLTFSMPDQAADARWHVKTILLCGKRL